MENTVMVENACYHVFFFDLAFFPSQAIYGAGPLPTPHCDPWESLPPSEPLERDSNSKCFLGDFRGKQEPLRWLGDREGLIPLCLLHCEYLLPIPVWYIILSHGDGQLVFSPKEWL